MKLSKEISSLMQLCFEITENTISDVFFRYTPYPTMKKFEVSVYERGWSVSKPIFLTPVFGEEITITNIKDIKQELLKYKGEIKC